MESDDDEDEFSPSFSPEQQTLSAIQSGFSSPAWLGTSPSHSTSMFNKSFSHSSQELPTAEEAFSVASTPPISQNGESPAHPLTMEATSYNRWDFDQLFNKRRRWNQGSRGSFEDEDEGDAEGLNGDRGRASALALGRRTSRSAAGRVLVERSIDERRSRSLVGGGPRSSLGRELSSSRLSQEVSSQPDRGESCPSSGPGTIVSDEERQRLAFEQLRKVAMERLNAVGAHLDWSPKKG